MIKEGRYCSDVIKEEEDNEDFENSTKCWICDNSFVDDNDKVRESLENIEA